MCLEATIISALLPDPNLKSYLSKFERSIVKFLIIIVFLTLGLNAENDTALSDAFTKGKFLGNITLFDYNVDKKM